MCTHGRPPILTAYDQAKGLPFKAACASKLLHLSLLCVAPNMSLEEQLCGFIETLLCTHIIAARLGPASHAPNKALMLSTVRLLLLISKTASTLL